MMLTSINRPLFLGIILFTVVFVSLHPYTIYAQTPDPLNVSAQAGFDGACRVNTWEPVKITLENKGSDFNGLVEAQQTSFQVNNLVYSQAVNLASQSRKDITLYVYMQGYETAIEVNLLSAEKKIKTVLVNVNCITVQDRLYGVMTDNPTPFNFLIHMDPPVGKAYITRISPADIPDQAKALEMLDTLVISGVDTGALTSEQRSALMTWVSKGGQLIIGGGLDWQRTSAGLVDMLPIKPQGTDELSDLNGLAQGSNPEPDLQKQTSIVYGVLKPGAKILFAQGDKPLAISQVIGTGRVLYFTFDLGAQPFITWAGRENFYSQFLDNPLGQPGWGMGFRDWNEAHQVITRIDNLLIPGPGEFLIFLLVYVLVIGPSNYFILRRLKRRELAWITIPGIVLFFTLMAFVLGSLIHGQQALLHRISVVEVFPQTSQARVNGLIGIYSPNRATYQLQISPGLLIQPLPVSMYGGALQTDQQDLTALQQPDGSTLIKDIKVNVGDIQPFVTSGQVQAPSFKENLSLKLYGSNAILDGNITNQSNLTLERATLLTPGGIYELGTFSPGETQNIHLSYSVDSTSIYNNGSNLPDYNNNYFITYGSTGNSKEQWISSLVGTSDNSIDPEASKRNNLISSLSEGSLNFNSESNIYLGGWTKTSPYKTELINQKKIADDMTLYLVKIDPQISVQSNQVIFSPGLFTWRIFSNKATSATTSPYNFASQQGTFTFAYRPIYPVSYQSVKSLFIHMNGKNTGSSIKFKVSLWNYHQQTWHDLNLVSLGDFEIPNPQDFVDPEGEIRLQIDNPDSSATNSDESVDFTLALNM